MRTTARRAAALGLAALLTVAACSGDDAADAPTTTSSADRPTDGDPTADGSGAGVEVGDLDVLPAIADLRVEPDAKAGANLFLEVAGFRFAPEHASGDHVAGEGHARIRVDGEEVARLYTEAFHLDLAAGTHDVRVDLVANDGRPLLVDGDPVRATASVTVPEAAGGHGHGGAFAVEGPGAPTVAVDVAQDERSGFDVRLTTEGFAFTPELASTPDTEPGQGHAHLYLDGEKVARLYGDWYHLDVDLAPGVHELRVELNANDHAPYEVDGEPIEAVATVVVAGEEGEEEPLPDVALGTIVEVSFAEGEVVGGGRRVVELDSTVTLRITSDVAEEIHVHGYERYEDLVPGESVDVTFVADIPGVFEVELHDAGIPLVELQVS